MNREITRGDLDRVNKRVSELVAEGFPSTAALGEAWDEMKGIPSNDGLEGRIKLTLLRASDDESHQSAAFQQEIRELETALKTSGVEASARWITQDSAHGWCGYVGVLAIAIPTVVPAVRAVIVAYMKRRTGRKVQVEFDGVKMKIEEPTADEADRVLKLIEQRRNEKRQKK